MLKNLINYNLVLGSQSPRRQELLKGLGLTFSVKVADTSEDFDDTLPPHKIAMSLALQKAEKIKPKLEANYLLITCDTIVYIQGRVLNKPKNAQEAFSMLNTLNNSVHNVYTGVCITTSHKQKLFYSKTGVLFSQLTNEEITYYIKKYEPYDKAGSYGVQEWMGYVGIKKIEGCFYNVMGLPLSKLYKELKQF